MFITFKELSECLKPEGYDRRYYFPENFLDFKKKTQIFSASKFRNKNSPLFFVLKIIY